MLECLILGDSIALGVAMERPECRADAVVGITSGVYVRDHGGLRQARTVVLSLGVNDGAGVATLDNLRRVRSSVSAGRVFWLLPGAKPGVRTAVRIVAGEHGDRIIDLAPLVGADGIHPDRAGYMALASSTGGSQIGPVGSPVKTAAPARVGLPPGSGAYYPITSPYSAIPPRDWAYHALPKVTYGFPLPPQAPNPSLDRAYQGLPKVTYKLPLPPPAPPSNRRR